MTNQTQGFNGQKLMQDVPLWMVITGSAASTFVISNSPLLASDQNLHPPHYPWNHKGFTQSLDTASVRRGFQVYKEVCSMCHSLKFIAFRNLVGVVYTEEQAKRIAKEYTIEDG